MANFQQVYEQAQDNLRGQREMLHDASKGIDYTYKIIVPCDDGPREAVVNFTDFISIEYGVLADIVDTVKAMEQTLNGGPLFEPEVKSFNEDLIRLVANLVPLAQFTDFALQAHEMHTAKEAILEDVQ